MTLYVDMDGVLADFDKHYKNTFGYWTYDSTEGADWSLIKNFPDFYESIPPMKDFKLLWDYVKVYNPVLLTDIPYSIESAERNKRNWAAKHLGEDVKVICCPSREKYLHAIPGDILIDDREKYKHLWINNGGIWITHHNAITTIKRLELMQITM